MPSARFGSLWTGNHIGSCRLYALMRPRNAEQIARLDQAPASGEFRFVVLGDSGAAPNPVGDAILRELLSQAERRQPRPAFIVHLGDFAGPGTVDRHQHYLRQVAETTTLPNVCVMGNHDGDAPDALETFVRIHGDRNFSFAYGDALFVALGRDSATGGPAASDLAFLEHRLADSDHAVRVVVTHQPPHLDGHYAPHADWGFRTREAEFLELLRAHRVQLVCAAHLIAYDFHVRDGIGFLVSGGGGWGLCSHFGTCNDPSPPARGSFYHFTEIAVRPNGRLTGRVVRAYHGIQEDARYGFELPTRCFAGAEPHRRPEL
jgi:hypothetical protein